MCQTRRCVSVRITLIALAFVVSGCAALGTWNRRRSLAGRHGRLFRYRLHVSTHSSIELNAANVELVRAQAQMQKAQADELSIKREELENERAATVGILREMSIAREDPTLADVALWVQAGGDPDYAMHYALQGPPKTTAKQE